METLYDKCPIDPGNQIRVLRIQPSSDPSTIVCVTLDIVSLDGPTHPVYNALSYCWGDESIRNDIVLNGAKISVTASLESALKHLRKDSDEFHIWADAVCIDQDDSKKEKNIQVLMMDRVYKEAEMVIVWLGTAEGDSDLAMDACEEWGSRTLGSEDQSREGDVKMDEDVMRAPSENRRYILSQIVDTKFDRTKWLAVQRLFSREYWQRLWIYQEIQLARNVLVKCGNKEVAWRCFAGLNIAWGEIYRKKVDLEEELSSRTWELISNCGMNRLNMFFDHALTGLTRQDESFYQVLRRTANQKCRDGRDRMYAILGLPKEGKSYPEPNYKLTVADVYKQYAIEYIYRTGSLEWLNEASCRKHKIAETIDRWPSWLPDWRVEARHGIVFRKYGEVSDWYYASRLYDIFGRNPVIKARQQDEADKTNEVVVEGASTTQETRAITKDEEQDVEDVDTSRVFDLYHSIIRPPGIFCDTISKVASLPVLSMGYSQINRFIEQGQDRWSRGYYPNGLPIFNVLYRTLLMGIYPVNMGFGSIFPITESAFSTDLARGFLLQVACDSGYLYEIPEESSGLSKQGGWGETKVARYEWTTPTKHVDFRFWDLDTMRIAEKDNPRMSDNSASLAEENKEFATFQSFIEARKKDTFDERMISYWFLLHHWRTRVRDATEGRTLFLTKHGLIGLATNPYIKQGDLVTVLYGGKTPFILRHMGSRMDVGSVHNLVTDAYIYGLMEGEAFTRASQWEHGGTGEPAFRQFAIM